MKIASDSKEFLVIDDFYTQREQIEIWKELDFLTSDRKLLSAKDSGSSVFKQTGELLKQNSAVFLDSVYSKREFSNIANPRAISPLKSPIGIKLVLFTVNAS